MKVSWSLVSAPAGLALCVIALAVVAFTSRASPPLRRKSPPDPLR